MKPIVSYKFFSLLLQFCVFSHLTLLLQGSIENLVYKLYTQDAGVQERAAWALKNLAANADNKVKIAAAGAIPPLVALLGPQCSAGVQEQAAGALRNIAWSSDDIKASIRSSGGVAALTQLMQSSPSDKVKSKAKDALDRINK